MTLRELLKVATLAVYESTLIIYNEETIKHRELIARDNYNKYLDYIVDDVHLTVVPDVSYLRCCTITPKMIICIYKGE